MLRTASSKWSASSSSRFTPKSKAPKSKTEVIKMFQKKYSTRSDHLLKMLKMKKDEDENTEAQAGVENISDENIDFLNFIL